VPGDAVGPLERGDVGGLPAPEAGVRVRAQRGAVERVRRQGRRIVQIGLDQRQGSLARGLHLAGGKRR